MKRIEIVDVNMNGERLDGSPMMTATDMAVKAGFMVNVPVWLRFPDGRLVKGHDGRITQKGMAAAARQMGSGGFKH